VDCPADVAFSRKNDAPDTEYLSDRRELYLKLADRYGWVKVDGLLPPNEIALQIRERVYQKLSIMN
jgi:thymidylate kinase